MANVADVARSINNVKDQVANYKKSFFQASATSISTLVAVTKAGNGKITSSDQKIDCGTLCDGKYQEATQIMLTATPDQNNTFVKWEGDCTGSNSTCSVSTATDKKINAIFAEVIQ